MTHGFLLGAAGLGLRHGREALAKSVDVAPGALRVEGEALRLALARSASLRQGDPGKPKEIVEGHFLGTREGPSFAGTAAPLRVGARVATHFPVGAFGGAPASEKLHPEQETKPCLDDALEGRALDPLESDLPGELGEPHEALVDPVVRRRLQARGRRRGAPLVGLGQRGHAPHLVAQPLELLPEAPCLGRHQVVAVLTVDRELRLQRMLRPRGGAVGAAAEAVLRCLPGSLQRLHLGLHLGTALLGARKKPVPAAPRCPGSGLLRQRIHPGVRGGKRPEPPDLLQRRVQLLVLGVLARELHLEVLGVRALRVAVPGHLRPQLRDVSVHRGHPVHPFELLPRRRVPDLALAVADGVRDAGALALQVSPPRGGALGCYSVTQPLLPATVVAGALGGGGARGACAGSERRKRCTCCPHRQPDEGEGKPDEVYEEILKCTRKLRGLRRKPSGMKMTRTRLTAWTWEVQFFRSASRLQLRLSSIEARIMLRTVCSSAPEMESWG